MRLALAGLFWFTLAGALSAQTVCETSCSVKEGEAVTVFTELVPAASTYGLTVNGWPASTQPFWTASTIEFPFLDGFAEGSYTFQITCDQQACTNPGVLTVVAAQQPSTGCFTEGQQFAPGEQKTWGIHRQKEVGPFISQRESEGWELLAATRFKGITTVKMECKGF